MDCARWRQHSVATRAALGLPPKSTPWSSGAQLRGLRGDRDRRVDLLDIAFSERRNAAPYATEAELRSSFWANISQGVQRRPWGDLPPVLCRQSMVYSFEADAVLSGWGHLLLLGWPRSTAPRAQATDGDLRDLAGESYSVPIMAMLTYAVYCCPEMPWW